MSVSHRSLGPTGGRQFLGPGPTDAPAGFHQCFSDRIIAAFAKGRIYAHAGNQWRNEVEEVEWANSFEGVRTNRCRDFCVVSPENTSSPSLAFPSANHQPQLLTPPTTPAVTTPPAMQPPATPPPGPYAAPPRDQTLIAAYPRTAASLAKWESVEIAAKSHGLGRLGTGVHQRNTLLFKGQSVQEIAEGIVTGFREAVSSTKNPEDHSSISLTSMALIEGDGNENFPVCLGDLLNYREWDFEMCAFHSFDYPSDA